MYNEKIDKHEYILKIYINTFNTRDIEWSNSIYKSSQNLGLRYYAKRNETKLKKKFITHARVNDAGH